MLIFRLELDTATLRAVAREARATLRANGQDRTGWGNALEKADEELKVEPFVDVHLGEHGTILGLLYPPHERIGVTYYVQSDRCQCEAFTAPSNPDDADSPPQRQPCRHRAKLRLVERVADQGGAHPVRISDTARIRAAATAAAAPTLPDGHCLFPVPPRIRPPEPAARPTRRSRKRAA